MPMVRVFLADLSGTEARPARSDRVSFSLRIELDKPNDHSNGQRQEQQRKRNVP
jgi:hypothetical protein